MLIYKSSSNTQLIFTIDKTMDFNSIIRELKYGNSLSNLESNNITVNFSEYYTSELGGSPIITTSIKDKNNNLTSYILNDTYPFNYNGSNIGAFLDLFRLFGRNARLRFKDTIFSGEYLKADDNTIKTTEGKTILFKNSISKGDIKNIHIFIHYLKRNNGQLLLPLIKLYTNILVLSRGARKLLVGYVNLYDYLSLIKGNISSNIPNSSKNADYIISFYADSPEIKLKVSDVINNNLIVDLISDADLNHSENNNQPIPFVLFNTRPIVLLNQKMPYFVVNHKGINVFITPLFFNGNSYLKRLKGGVDLLQVKK